MLPGSRSLLNSNLFSNNLDPNNIVYLFLFAIGWGICDAVWQCALNALYGVLFKDDQEAAFANYRLWESLGFCAAFAYGNSLDASVKLIICLVFLIIGSGQC